MKKIKHENQNIETCSYSGLFSFYLPLALQAISQSFTYPLVAIVAARGDSGSLNVAALAQAHIVLFFLMTICAGLLTSGMVFCVNREGLERFRILNFRFTALIVFLHILFCTGFFSKIIFQSLMGLNQDLLDPTFLAFVLSLPYPALFNARNTAMVVLFNKKMTGLAYSATLGRIILTLLLSIIFSYTGLVGIFWAVVCQTIPIVFEVIAMNWLAKPHIEEIRKKEGKSASISEMTLFTMSFSSGKVLVAFSSYIIAGFAARAANPEIMLPVYYSTMGLMNPFAFAATRIQATVMTFGHPNARNTKLFIFTVATGLAAGLIPLLFILPGLSRWYYCELQKIPPESIRYIVQSALYMTLIPVFIAIRSYVEGWAAYFKKPIAVIAGQGVYLGAVVSSAFFAFNAGAQGNVIGPVSLIFGNIFATIILALAIKVKESPPTIQTPPPALISSP
jgi:hypothetical protein